VKKNEIKVQVRIPEAHGNDNYAIWESFKIENGNFVNRTEVFSDGMTEYDEWEECSFEDFMGTFKKASIAEYKEYRAIEESKEEKLIQKMGEFIKEYGYTVQGAMEEVEIYSIDTRQIMFNLENPPDVLVYVKGSDGKWKEHSSFRIGMFPDGTINRKDYYRTIQRMLADIA